VQITFFRPTTSNLHAVEGHKTITPRSSQIAAFITLTMKIRI